MSLLTNKQCFEQLGIDLLESPIKMQQKMFVYSGYMNLNKVQGDGLYKP